VFQVFSDKLMSIQLLLCIAVIYLKNEIQIYCLRIQ